MPTAGVRPFRRSDRDQLTQLINAHAEAVVPGMGAWVGTHPRRARAPARRVHHRSMGRRAADAGGGAPRSGCGRRAPAALFRRRAGRRGRPRRRLNRLVPVLAAGSGGQPLLAGRDRGRRPADGRVHRPVRPVGRDPPGEHRRQAAVPGIYGIPDQWPHVRALYERIRVCPYRSYRGCLPGQGRRPAPAPRTRQSPA